MPPRGRPIANDRLYRIAVIGGGFHGLLTSPTTHIPGLVSIVDIAPTDLAGHPTTSLSWKPSKPTRVGQLSRLDHAIGANNRLKFAALFILAGVLLALALLGLRAAMTAVPAALLVNLALGIGQVSNEVLLCAAISAGTALVAFALARLCRSESALLALYGGVVALYAVRHGHATGVAGGEPVRPDAELAVLGDRQPGRDAAARAAPRGRVPRATAFRDRRLRRCSASSASS